MHLLAGTRASCLRAGTVWLPAGGWLVAMVTETQEIITLQPCALRNTTTDAAAASAAVCQEREMQISFA